MPKRFDVRFNPKLIPYIQEALKKPEIKAFLKLYNFKENEQGIARLALTLFLEDNGIFPKYPRDTSIENTSE